ncbi:MAG: signal peptidase I [Armatimonadota bacterium]
MDWLANLSIKWVVVGAIVLALARIGVAKAKAIPKSVSLSLGEFIEALLFALVLVFLVIRPFVIQAFYIPSASMRPSLWENDRILVNKFIYRFRPPQRYDVIVFKAPPEASLDEKDFIKRVIGLPGEIVEVHDGQVYINHKPLDEHYVGEECAMWPPKKVPARTVIRPDYEYGPYKVPPHKLFVMGDNRNNSKDSHYWQALSMDRVLGKAMVIFWPPSRIGLVR